MFPLAWTGLMSRRDLLRAGSVGVAASLWPKHPASSRV